MSMQLASVSFSLAAVFCWGTSDFVGGYAARRTNAFLLATMAHATGALLMTSLAALNHSAFPPLHGVRWALAAGLSGGAALAILYRSLASGRMGLNAPIAAVVAAAIPVAFGMITEGLPANLQIAGFLLAGLGIWLVSRSEDGARPAGLGMAVMAAVGFAGFFLCARRAGDGSALWIAAMSRSAAFVLTAAIILLGRVVTEIDWGRAGLAALAGCLDVSGTALFVRASQTGRLDVAVVVSSLYPAVTVLLARLFLHERFTPWKVIGMMAAVAAVPMIAA
jgi:drug/metabolite transporter (DMT)-like permease